MRSHVTPRRAPKQARQAGSAIRSLDNSLKRLVGQQEGLMNPRMMAKKEAEEKALRDAVARKPDVQKAYGDAWDQIATAYRALPRDGHADRVHRHLTPSRLGQRSRRQLVRYAEEIRKPNDQRYDEFRDSKLESLKFSLLSPAPIYPEMEEAMLAGWLEEAQKTLGARRSVRPSGARRRRLRQLPRNRLSAEQSSRDVALRKSLLEGGAEAIAKSDDPMIALARRIEPVIREFRAWNEVDDSERR